LPNNINLKLYDDFNDSVIQKVIYNNSTYTFDELFAGDYTVYVDTPGIKYFKDNFTLTEGEIKNSDLSLIPLVPVKGRVFNDIIGDGIDNSDLVDNAHVEFYNIDNSTLSNVLKTDAKGLFSGNITKGNYTLYIQYTNGVYDYVHISSLTVKDNSPRIHTEIHG